MRTDKPSTPLPIALMVVMVAMALTCAWGRELWLDEAHSAYLATHGLATVWRGVVGDVHPPLYFVGLWSWGALIGTAPMALRLFSIAAAASAVAITWLTARTGDDEQAGTVAIVLMALSPALVIFAVEIRMYALAICAIALALYAIRRARLAPSTRHALIAGGLGAVAAFTHYVTLIAVVGLFATWFLVELRNRERRRTALIAGITAALAIAAWLPILLAQRTHKATLGADLTAAYGNPATLVFGSTAVAPRSLVSSFMLAAQDTASILGVFPAESTILLAILALPFGILMLLALRRAVGGDPWTWILIGGGMATVVGMVLLGIGGRRYLVPLIPISALIFARGTTDLPRSWTQIVRITLVATAAVLVAGSIRVVRAPKPTPVQDAIRYLSTNAGPQDIAVFHAPYAMLLFDYYADRTHLAIRRSGFPESTIDWWQRQAFQGWGSAIPTHGDVDRVERQLRDLPDAAVLWLVLYETGYYDPTSALEHRLGTVGVPTEPWRSTDGAWRLVRIASAGPHP